VSYQAYDDLFVTPRPVSRENKLPKEAFLFTATVLALLFYGLIVLYSASYDEALRNGLKGSYYFSRQLLFALLGLIVFTLLRWIPLKLIRRLTPLLLLASFALMFLTLFTPWGVTRYGARRWIQIGTLPSFQPSELLKVSAILFVALLLSKWDGKSLFTPLISVVTLLFFISPYYYPERLLDDTDFPLRSSLTPNRCRFQSAVSPPPCGIANSCGNTVPPHRALPN